MQLLDSTCSDPSKMLLTMIKTPRRTGRSWADWLYKVTLDIMWTCKTRLDNFIPRVGGMHQIMSFFSAVGTLMRNSGLLPWLKSAFGGTDKMLIANLLMNVGALWFAMGKVIKGPDIPSGIFWWLTQVLWCMLSLRYLWGIFSKHWKDSLICPVFLMCF